MNEWDIAISTIRSHGRTILFGIGAGMILALCITLLQKNIWQAEMIVGPTERTGMPSLSSFLPKAAADAPALQYFVNRIDAADSTDFTRFETLLISPQTVESATKEDKTLLPYETLSDNRTWLDRNLKIRPYGLTPYSKITLRHTDAEKARAILSALYSTTDRSVRQEAIVKTNRRIAYLKDQLDKIRNPDHRNAVIALLKEQEQTAMMAAIDNAFAAEIITPPYILPQPVAPDPILLFPALAFAGGLCGLMAGGFIKALKK